MAYLKYIEKETICRLFGISGGFVFKYWSDSGLHNKNKTKDLIFEACGINIYEDAGYRGLSQEKCIRKIWDESSPQMIANLLETLLDYFCYIMEGSIWSDEELHEYEQVQEIIKRLKDMSSVELPTEQAPQTLSVILDDIENNLRNQKPELIVDRLHTFTTEFMRHLCASHAIRTEDFNGNELPLHSLAGQLAKWYRKNGYLDSDFSDTACKCTISLFEKYNHVRNDHSAAHPNQLLSKAEAEYVVKIVADTLTFLDKLEKSHSQNVNTQDNGWLLWEEDDEYPF